MPTVGHFTLGSSHLACLTHAQTEGTAEQSFDASMQCYDSEWLVQSRQWYNKTLVFGCDLLAGAHTIHCIVSVGTGSD